MSLFSFIRKKYHPLFHLRRLAAFPQLQRVIDHDVWIKVPSGGRGGMCVKLLRDLTLILPHDGKEAATCRWLVMIFRKLLLTMDSRLTLLTSVT